MPASGSVGQEDSKLVVAVLVVDGLVAVDAIGVVVGVDDMEVEEGVGAGVVDEELPHPFDPMPHGHQSQRLELAA